jgi:hypothetical protein
MRLRISLVAVTLTAVVWLTTPVWADAFFFSTGNPFKLTVAALNGQYGGLFAAYSTLGYRSVKALKAALRQFCEP